MGDAFTVGWTQMSEGTKNDYVHLDRLYRNHTAGELVGNLLATFRLLEGPTLGYRIDRARHMASPHYDRCVDFRASYDQNCFDPDHDDLPLEEFTPLVEEVFTRPAREYRA